MARPKLAHQCSLANCGAGGKIVRGFCPLHYTRWKRYGNPHVKHKPGHAPRGRQCELPDCEASHYARGFCARHYERFRIYGDPNMSRPPIMPKQNEPRLSAEERFWLLVDKSEGQGPNGDCWEWKAGRTPAGYGWFRVTTRQPPVTALRFSLQIKLGRKVNAFALHTCDNPACVRPEHLYEGTARQNVKDRDDRQRTATGERHGKSKYTTIQIAQAKKLLSRNVRPIDVAKQTGLSYATVSAIKHNRYWNHIVIEEAIG